MTTLCELQFHGAELALARVAALQIEARVLALEKRYNFHSLTSWLTTHVNNRRRDSVPIDTECAAVLHIVRQHAQHTQGAFDITVGTLAGQLRRARTTAEVAAIRKRLAPYSGLGRWHLSKASDANFLCFDNAYTRIDLGGVIKEHAVDVAVRMAQDAGVTAGLVNFGGDVFAFGRRSDQNRFVASVPDPLRPGHMLFAMDLEDQALTTSAHYARNRPIRSGSGGDGSPAIGSPNANQLSHVVSTEAPRAPADSRWISASVVSRSALVSGIYSTALLIRHDLKLPTDVLAVVVDASGQPHTLHATHSDASAPQTSTDTNTVSFSPTSHFDLEGTLTCA